MVLAREAGVCVGISPRALEIPLSLLALRGEKGEEREERKRQEGHVGLRADDGGDIQRPHYNHFKAPFYQDENFVFYLSIRDAKVGREEYGLDVSRRQTSLNALTGGIGGLGKGRVQRVKVCVHFVFPQLLG